MFDCCFKDDDADEDEVEDEDGDEDGDDLLGSSLFLSCS